MAALYLLQADPDALPKASDIERYYANNGVEVSEVKVYPNGQVKLMASELASVDWLWQSYAPIPETFEDTLGVHVKALLTAERDLITMTPEHKRTPEQRLLLALSALVKVGYGVEP